jgi:ArsR family transcriptional regulator
LPYHGIKYSETTVKASAQTSARGSVRNGTRLTRARRTAVLKALADPKRFELLERIAKASCPLGCLQARNALAISPATLSHHVKELETAGLIQVAREGKFHYLSIRPGVLDTLAATLRALGSESCTSR